MTVETFIMLAIFIVLFLSLPLIMLLLERKGVVTAQWYLAQWKGGVLAMAIAAMILSPGGDPISMMLMLALLAASYFAGAVVLQTRGDGSLDSLKLAPFT